MRKSILRTLGLAGLLGLSACGGGAVCGNGVVEAGEDCDKGTTNGATGVNCSADCKSISIPIAQLSVTWDLLQHTGVDGYHGGGCTDIGAVTAHVVLAGPTPTDEMLRCLDHSRVYSNKVAAGSYSATVTLLDQSGAPVTRAITTRPLTVTVGGDTGKIVVDFESADFIRSYTGTLQLRTGWGDPSLDCQSATPPVDQQSFSLTPLTAQTPLSGKTVDGTPLDGTPAACHIRTSQEIYEVANDLPTGAYHLKVQGYSNKVVTYCKAVDIYIGPGKNSQPWEEVIPLAGSPTDGGGCM